jgi:hypothetical protein
LTIIPDSLTFAPVNIFKRATLVFLLAVSACHAQPVLNASTAGGNHIMLSWPVTNTTFGLEYADSPTSTNWTQVKADVTNALCVVMDGVTNSARFFRLISPFGTNLPPMFPAGVIPTADTDQIPEDNDDGHLGWDFDANLQAQPATIDFSNLIDPSSPTNNSISYYWDVESDDQGDQLVGPQIYGVTTPVISFTKDGVANDNYDFELYVMSNYSGLVTRFDVYVWATGSDFSLMARIDCLKDPSDCTVAAVFGTSHHTAVDGYESFPPWVLAYRATYVP